MTETANSQENPIWMKLVRDEEGIKWGNVVIALLLTAASGYLASQSQRLGSKPDMQSLVRMRVFAFGERLGNEITKAGIAVSIASARAYDRARPV
jgi:hypothetical protein